MNVLFNVLMIVLILSGPTSGCAKKSENIVPSIPVATLAYPFVKLLAASGLRRSEALNLKWSDIDNKLGFIHVRKSKNGKSRTIPLEPDALDALSHLNLRTEYLFTQANGNRPNRHALIKPFQRAARRIGIAKRVDLHCLRHSWGSNKIRAGWGLKKVSMILGHSDISLTAAIYTHLLDGDLKVRDDFQFDKSLQTQNSSKDYLASVSVEKPASGTQTEPGALEDGNFDVQTVIAMIQILQKQLKTLGNPAPVQPGNGAVQPTTEESRKITKNTPTTSRNTHLCYPNATHTKDTPPPSGPEGPKNVENLITFRKLQKSGRRVSNPRPRAWEARALAN